MPDSEIIFSHWFRLLEQVNTSPLAFYEAVEAEIGCRAIPDVQLSQAEWREGGWFTARRMYLRIRRRDLVFDLCGAPFGNAFFISWWLGQDHTPMRDFFAALPLAGALFTHAIRPGSFYKIDMALMFQEAVHASVLTVVDALTTANGARDLTEAERAPILTEFFTR